MSKKQFDKYVEAFLTSVHTVTADEKEEFIKDVKEKSPEDFESYKSKMDFISEEVKKLPYLKENYLVYSSSKADFFRSIGWETGLKVSHSPGSLHRGIIPDALPFARIRVKTYSGREMPPILESHEFEITERDLSTMLDSLKNLRNALRDLKTKKLV